MTRSTPTAPAGSCNSDTWQLQPESKADFYGRSQTELAAAGIDRLLSILPSSFGQSGLQVWQRKLRERSCIFYHPEGRDPDRLREALDEFRAAAGWFDALRQHGSANDARWCVYLALNRLGRVGEALEAAEELRVRLERARALVADPQRRAGHIDTYPQLHAAMAGCCADLDDPRRMLAVIESAKGRALDDLLTTGSGGVARDEGPQFVDPDQVAALVTRLGISYVSFLVTDDDVFGVCIDSRGGWHWQRVAMNQTARRRLCYFVEPLHRYLPTRHTTFDMSAALAPLMDWLAPFTVSGHIVISPDGEMHQWPLHMAAVGGVPIGTVCGVSRVHGVAALRRIAATTPDRPNRAISIFLPAQDEGEVSMKADVMANTSAALPCATAVAPEAADEGFFATLDASHAVLYVNAHGTFPPAPDSDHNPFRCAGLMLAHQRALPVRSHEWPHRLTPELVMTSPGLFLDGTTVVLQGCVSGLAEEGLAGDALGLEWALLAKGATMVLASHWDVDYRSAGAFCRHFHQAWLHQGVSRIAAWREAVTRTRMDPEGGSPDDWAAFSLAGDWR